MTIQEFSTHYARLGEEFGQQAFGKGRGKLLFETIRGLPAAWWKDIVDRMILENNPRFNMAEAARSERNREYSIRRTEELCRQVDKGLEKVSDLGALKVFQEHGGQSFLEAVLNKKKNAI